MKNFFFFSSPFLQRSLKYPRERLQVK